MATNRPETITPSSSAPKRGEALLLAGDRGDREIDGDRGQHRQQRRDDHLLDRRLGDEVDGAGVIGPRGAVHDARVGAELLAHVEHDVARGAADRGHAHRPEQIGQQSAEQQADDDVRVGQREIDAVGADAELGRIMLEVGRVGAEQHQGAKRGRADRIALGDRLGGVADRVEGVGAGAHVLLHAGHLGDSAGIVGDRAVGVEGDDHAGEREHRGRGEGDSDQAGELVGDDDPGADHQRRQPRSIRG